MLPKFQHNLVWSLLIPLIKSSKKFLLSFSIFILYFFMSHSNFLRSLAVFVPYRVLEIQGCYSKTSKDLLNSRMQSRGTRYPLDQVERDGSGRVELVSTSVQILIFWCSTWWWLDQIERAPLVLRIILKYTIIILSACSFLLIKLSMF